MGVVLPKPILSKIVDRIGNNDVSGAVCSVNGHRHTMEDAHVMMLHDDRMIFGVFDGHSNDKCSAFLAQHLPPRLKSQPLPLENDMLVKICLDVDSLFMDDVGDGGSTATFCIVEKAKNNKYKATICNVGDSRILIVREGGVMFATDDHKPQNPGERQRIEKAGGTVRMNRVDGDLAVSRAFGDKLFKKNMDEPTTQKVIAVPDISVQEISPGDVMIVCCDGVFEGNFSNDEVAQFVEQQIKQAPSPDFDVGVVPVRVCDQAIRRGSKDNITCMVVHFTNGSHLEKQYGHQSFVPGPPYPRNHDSSRVAYTRMAQLGGFSLADALEKRWSLLQAFSNHQLEKLPPIDQTAYDMSDEVDVETERGFFGSGPPAGKEKQWFQDLAENMANR